MLLEEGPAHGLFQPGQPGLVAAGAPQVHQRDARMAHAGEAGTGGQVLTTGEGGAGNRDQ